MNLARSEVVSRRIRVTSAFNAANPLVMGNRVQLQQVVLNLVLNACDAMHDTHAEQRHLTLATARQNGFVQLVVSDRGVGIPKERLERVFEPFVTFRDQGLGIGLAISRSIVTAHRGSIRAENNVDGGATFRCTAAARRHGCGLGGRGEPRPGDAGPDLLERNLARRGRIVGKRRESTVVGRTQG